MFSFSPPGPSPCQEEGHDWGALNLTDRYGWFGSLIQYRRAFSGSHGLGIPLPFHQGHMLCPVELEAMGGADRNTGGFETGINAVHAIVTLDHLTDLRIPLGRPPRACGDTGLTSYTERVIHKDNSIFRSPLHGPCGAGRNAPWVFTVKTGHEYIRCTGFRIKKFRTNGDDLAGSRLRRQSFSALAYDFT